MKKLLISIITSALFFAVPLHGVAEEVAKEDAEGHEKKAPEEKAKPDSAVSFVSNLPEVKKWEEWLEGQGKGETLSAWGDALKQVDGKPCSEITVASVDAENNTHIWVYFCVTAGGSVLVETKPKTPEEAIAYLSYEDWKKKCHPTNKSPGIC